VTIIVVMFLLGVLIFTFAPLVVHSSVLVGNSDLGLAYDLNWYADPNGILYILPRMFLSPNNTNQYCLNGNVSSDILCQPLGTTFGQQSTVFSGYQHSSERSQSSGVGVDIGFSSSISHESESSYYTNDCFGVASEYDQYNYYTLSMDWRSRGLTQSFLNDLNSLSACTLTSKYGYYFLVAGIYGGSYTYTQSTTYSYSSTQQSFENSISASYAGFTSSNQWGQNTSGTDTFYQSQAKFYAKGGDYQCLHEGATCSWVTSCQTNPVLIDFDSRIPALISMADVLTAYNQPTIASAVQPCINNYLASLSVHWSSLTSQLTGGGGGGTNYCGLTVGTITKIECPNTDPNYFLTQVTLGFYDQSYTGRAGAEVVYLSCHFNPFAISNPNSMVDYTKTMVSGSGGNRLSSFDQIPGMKNFYF
jgi:hypothetical protein